MKMKEITQKARELGVGPIKGVGRVDLIHAIQMKEGNSPCYATAHDTMCDQFLCCWRENCFEDSRADEIAME